MVGGVKAVFVAGSANGWLFWNTDADLRIPEEGVRLTGLNSTAAFQLNDLA